MMNQEMYTRFTRQTIKIINASDLVVLTVVHEGLLQVKLKIMFN